MPKKEKQKAKIIALLRLFEKYSDEDHPLSVPHLLELLEKEYGIEAERKSIYSDIAALQDAGYDIVVNKGRTGGWVLLTRPFEMHELKLLTDAVQSSRFVSLKQSREISNKLMQFTSTWQQDSLNRQIVLTGRPKNENMHSIYAIDRLHSAINGKHQVSFTYLTRNTAKKRVSRRAGKTYTVSPFALTWQNECYYLIAYQEYEAPFNIRNYRVDRMENVEELKGQPRTGEETFKEFDLPRYLRGIFNMYGGERKTVRLRCDSKLSDVILDRFGSSIVMPTEPDGAHFIVDVDVSVSPQFYAWVAGFETEMEILSPADVRAGMRSFLSGTLEMYNK